MPPAVPLIRLEEVTRLYRLGEIEVRALDGVSLQIEQGEFASIVGASGSGKSTLMNLIGCLDRPTSGRYLLDGKDVSTLGVNDLATIRGRTIGFIFQNFNLLRRTSALENVELPLVYSGVPPAERRRRASEVLRRVGLEARMEHHPGQLSGGQQQRVAIARALVAGPRVLLADEPTGNLDSRTSAEVMDLIASLHSNGQTIVMVTHEPGLAARAAHVVVMRDGRIESDGRPGARRP